jgi:hypothetical protein
MGGDLDFIRFMEATDDGKDDSSGWNMAWKLISLFLILIITIMFGFFPYFW